MEPGHRGRSHILLCGHASGGAAYEENKYGRVIFTTSLTAVRGRPGIHAYVAAKTGLIGMTRSLACELAEHGITVNGVLPGYFETDLNAALLANKEFVDS